MTEMLRRPFRRFNRLAVGRLKDYMSVLVRMDIPPKSL